MYQQSVLDRATDAALGVPGRIEFLNLAAIRKLLDLWGEEYANAERQREREARARLPAPPEDPEMRERVGKRMMELADHMKRGFSPSTAPIESFGERIQTSEDAA